MMIGPRYTLCSLLWATRHENINRHRQTIDLSCSGVGGGQQRRWRIRDSHISATHLCSQACQAYFGLALQFIERTGQPTNIFSLAYYGQRCVIDKHYEKIV